MIALVVFVLFLVPCLAPAQMLPRQQQARLCIELNNTNSLAYIEPGLTQQSSHLADSPKRKNRVDSGPIQGYGENSEE
jgi:hypothetical protein